MPPPPVLVEESQVLRHEHRPGGQGILTLRAPGIAAHARAGSFVHVRCDPLLPMRRPMSVMSAHEDRIEILYKITGQGTRLLSRTPEGAPLDLLGPIGRPFRPAHELPHKILVAGGVGLPPILFLLESLVQEGHDPARLVLLYGSELPFPLAIHETQGAPTELVRSRTLAVPSVLASRSQLRPGIHPGYVTELLERRLAALTPRERAATEVSACGPVSMLTEVQKLCRRHGIGGELCLEEFMACAVGGCGGCAVSIRERDRIAMKRVCVDGPVFPMESVVFDAQG
jgi:dihydroorotate dehydrogenase electron transfer subunit